MININECKAHMYNIIGAIYEVRKEMGGGVLMKTVIKKHLRCN